MKSAWCSALAVAAAALSGFATAQSAAATKQCLRLTNSTASIYSAISFIADKNSDLANLPLNEILAPLDKELPWLSTCLASADILAVGLSLLSDPAASKCVSSLTGGSSSNSTLASAGEESLATSLCPSMNTTVFPCVNDVLVGAIEKLMASGGDCCTDMKAKLPELLGQDLKSFMTALMTQVGDLICSVKIYVDLADGKTKNETCGDALISTVLSGQDLDNLIQLLEIPSDQACSAMKGHNFTSTTGASYKFFIDQQPLDSCFAPMNSFFTELGKLPMISQSNISALFDNGKCLNGSTIITMTLNEQGIIQGMTEALDKVVAGMKLMPAGAVTKVMRDGLSDLQKDFGPMCFHLPNSVTDCVYDSTIVYAFSSNTPPPSTAKDSGSTPSASSSAALAPAFMVTIAATSVGTLLLSSVL